MRILDITSRHSTKCGHLCLEVPKTPILPYSGTRSPAIFGIVPLIVEKSVWSMLLDAVALDCQVEYLVGHRAVKYLNCEGFDLNSAAHSLAVACITSAISGTDNGRSNACILSKLVVEARHNGIDLLEHNHIAISPMLRLLHPELHNCIFRRYTGWKDLSTVLNAWLRLLQQLGVDLAAYGEKEWRLFQSIRCNYDCKRPWDAWHGLQPHSCYEQSIYKCGHAEYVSSELDHRPALFSFSYGAPLSDWNLWEIHPGDQYSGQFWAMVEQDGFPSEGKEFRVQEMPGGWLEDWEVNWPLALYFVMVSYTVKV